MPVIERTFKTWDGTELFYRAWLPEERGAGGGKGLLLFHRGHEHSGRWEETVAALGMGDVTVFAWDQRGHGKSPGERGRAPSLAAVVKDAECFARHVAAEHGVPVEEMGVVAYSLGAVIAAAWVHDYAPRLRGMVLAAPAFRVKLYVPLAVPCLRVMQRVLPRSVVKSFVKSKMLTHDAAQAAAYDADPLIFKQIAVNLLLDLHDTATRVVEDAAAIRVPTLVLAAGRDWVVKLGAQQEFFKRLGSPVKQMEVYAGQHHALFQETERGRIVGRVKGFLEECFAGARACEGALLEADKGGFTRTEYDLLRGPGSMKWRVMQGMMKTFGRMAEGVRLGWRTGFDSGLTLDYVYRNEARGAMGVGKMIDRSYLNSIGWRGIRVRRENLERMLRLAIEEVRRAGRGVHILDIASGPGRYVLETMGGMREVGMTAVLRDYREENLEAARGLAEKLKLSGVTVVKGDAFDRASLGALGGRVPRPTVTIASGIYELFPENGAVLESLRGIADAMEAGGMLIYTCQPWHPQMELIARTLVNREGKPWVMRRRTQGEMDALVQAAGFEKVGQEIDGWGIFTVSLARRVGR